MAGIPPLSYIVPFSSARFPSTMILECDIDLAFPFIELLLGGTEISNPALASCPRSKKRSCRM
jgi:flagellar motor switch protein FliM